MNTGMAFGKVISEESYFNGRVKTKTVRYQVPELVKDKNQVLQELMKCLELITSKQTSTLDIRIEADPKTHEFRLITRSYVVEKKS